MTEEHPLRPKWPPMWNPFEVFLLALSLASSVGFIRGTSGSNLLDERLDPFTVVMWGFCLAFGSVLALAGVWCYRTDRLLMPGLHLERAGLSLVGVAASVYTFLVLVHARDIDGVRFSSSVQVAYAAACFFRAWQDHRAIRRSYTIYRRMTRHATGDPNGR